MVKRILHKSYTLTTNLVLFSFRIGMLVGAIILAVIIYNTLLSSIINDDSLLLPLLAIWVFSAYIVIPRVHRKLTKLYIPNYFVGRTRTADGLLGDPVNLAILGSEKKLHRAMQAAGWTKAEDLSLQSSLRMVYASIRKISYPDAPVSSLYLFSRKQDFAYQKEVNNNPHARHHVRFWRTPKKWWLPGGYRADWIAAGTYDKSVGFSTLTGQITHKIEANTDEERDYIIKTLEQAKVIEKLEIKKHFTTAFRDKNGGGDQIETDGSLPFITLK